MKKLFKIGIKQNGKGKAIFSWHPDGQYLATSGVNGVVSIFSRNGERIDEIGLSKSFQIISLKWSGDGESLAILQKGNGILTLWNTSNRKTNELDANVQDPTFISWSKTGTQLAIGTSKGNLQMYNSLTRKKTPFLGKHPKEIVCGDWNFQDQLVLASNDGTVTLSKASGQTIEQMEVKGKPTKIFFDNRIIRKGSSNDSSLKDNNDCNTIIVNVLKNLVVLDIDDLQSPIEISFQKRYGRIIDVISVGIGQIITAFSEGFFVMSSINSNELGEEKFSAKFFKERITSLAYSKKLNRATICGERGLKVVNIHDMTEIEEDSIQLQDVEENEAHYMEYSSDAQILTISTLGGIVQNFLARMPNVNDYYKNHVAYLSSLREIEVIDILDIAEPIHISVTIEPSFIALGPYHVAVGMNNHVWFYRFDSHIEKKVNHAKVEKFSKINNLVNEQEYLGTVISLQLNKSFAAVFTEGKVILHNIEGDSKYNENKVFPEGDNFSSIKSVAMTSHFLIYGTQEGYLQFFYLKDWAMLDGSAYRHDEGIEKIAPNSQGNKIVFIDSRHQVFLYNVVTCNLIIINNIGTNINKVLWDPIDPGFFFLVENNTEINGFMYSPTTIYGETITKLGSVTIEEHGEYSILPQSTKLPHEHTPVLAYDGKVVCQKSSGVICQIESRTHDRLQPVRENIEKLKECFEQNLLLNRLQECWKVAKRLDEKAYWLALAGKAMEQLNVTIATRVYRYLGDAGMVLALEKLNEVEDRNLLAGKIQLLFGDYAKAQELLLISSQPITALQMQRNLLHWDQALRLASTLAPDQVPELSAAYGQQLEFIGDNSQALKQYEKALEFIEKNKETILCDTNMENLYQKCMGGIARTCLRLGDIRRGSQIVMDMGSNELCKECGVILETMKQLPDAAELYEKGHHYEKAVNIYIQIKKLNNADALMKHITVPKLHNQFAKAKEASGHYAKAVESYTIAQDINSVVRLLLEKMKDPEKAFSIVRSSRSCEGALSLAKHCSEIANFRGAIEFLLMAKKLNDAFDMAENHDEMDVFVNTLGDDISIEQAQNVAQYYEKKKQQLGKAGYYYQLCGNHHKALKLFLQCGEKEIDRAVEVVGKARNDMLTHTLIDFLMGETDGVPKDPNYIFRLYMALGNFTQAAKTALIISRQEQDLGNYKIAHGILFEIYSKLEQNEIQIPQALNRALMLLHSYLLVKRLVKRGDHNGAALMLIRVSENISKFSSHIVNILTSTVIECQRANMKAKAYEYAVMLMRPEYRQSIEIKFKRKIEAMVRRPPREENSEETSPCPQCDNSLPVTELDCVNCKNRLPYCISTGQHMVKSDWCTCPHCKFPALYSHFIMSLEIDDSCPMCNNKVDIKSLQMLSEKEICIGSNKSRIENQMEEEPQS